MKINKRGDAMITVLCIMLVFMMLSLTMLLAASSMLGSSRQNAINSRCRIAAESFSEMLGQELRDSGKGNTYQKSVQEMIMADAESDFSHCWTQNSESNSKWDFTVNAKGKDSSGQFGFHPIDEILSGYNITLNLYWGEKDLTTEEIKEKLYLKDDELTDVVNPIHYTGNYLYTEVTCSKGKIKYTIRQRYQITVSMKSDDEADPIYEWSFK